MTSVQGSVAAGLYAGHRETGCSEGVCTIQKPVQIDVSLRPYHHSAPCLAGVELAGCDAHTQPHLQSVVTLLQQSVYIVKLAQRI